jgi:hypothetical protein
MVFSDRSRGIALIWALRGTSDTLIVMAVVLSLDRHLMKEGYVCGANCTDRQALDRRKDALKMNAAPQ